MKTGTESYFKMNYIYILMSSLITLKLVFTLCQGFHLFTSKQKELMFRRILKKTTFQHAVLQFSNQEALKDVFSIQIQAS